MEMYIGGSVFRELKCAWQFIKLIIALGIGLLFLILTSEDGQLF